MVRTSTDSTAGLNIIIKIIIIIIVVVAIIVILVAPYTTRLLFRQFNFHLEEQRDCLSQFHNLLLFSFKYCQQ